MTVPTTIFSINKFFFSLCLLFTIALLTTNTELVSQERYIWEPKISVSTNLSNRWEIQSSTLARQDLNFGSKNYIPVEKIQSKASLTHIFFNNTKAGISYVFAGAELFRPAAEAEHRMVEQYAFYFYFSKVRLGNRIRTAQRFYPDTYKNRVRYRLSVDFPLRGGKLNIRELYFVASNEILMNFNAWHHDFENRLAAGVGWKISEINTIQLQLQHRIYDIGLQEETHAIFFASALYFSL